MEAGTKKIVVLGGGESGVGAALLAQQKGFEVFVSDQSAIKEEYKEELLKAAIPFEEKQHTEKKILAADEVIKSPGIPDTVPLIQALVSKGIPMISEIEFGARYTDALLVAITGSNGKTTTATLIHHLLKEAGRDAILAGNVGLGFARCLAEGLSPAIFVLELSSFQLDGILSFRPHLAALINITPDHLDRYNYEINNYIDSKCRIGMNQEANDFLWYFQSDTNIQTGFQRNTLKSQLLPIGLDQIKGEKVHLNETENIDLSKSNLKGKHNALNTLFAANICRQIGLTIDEIQRAVNTFQAIPHRMEWVGELNGADYINDSKATNVDATFYALDAMEKSIIWIAGGTDKGNDYESIMELVKNKVRILICLGADNTKLKANFEKYTEQTLEVQSAQKAVTTAMEFAQKGEVVLLSPACASFDLFKNYMARGDQFRQAVLGKMKEKTKN